jgi:hypothetical protein
VFTSLNISEDILAQMSIEFVGNTYELDRLVKPTRDVTFYTDRTCVKDDGKLKIYIQQEPATINQTINEVPSCWQKFDAILTFNDEVLKTCPNARFYHIQTVTWIDEGDYKHIDTSTKQFLVSNITGFKSMCDAHVFRHKIYLHQHLFNSNLFVFFRSSAHPVIPAIQNNPLIGNELGAKMILFRSFQFSLVIENTRELNGYTEKLVDCLVTKTIPIYYGSKNVGDFFDTTGWILIENQSVEEIVEKCKVLHPGYYAQYADVIEKNYTTALSRIDNYKRLNDILVTIPGYL